MSRFSYVKYDEETVKIQNRFKGAFEELEKDVLGLPPGRAQSLVLTHLEEAYMWIGKALRDRQLTIRGGEEQPERKDG